MNTAKNSAQQGDVLFKRLDAFPAGEKKLIGKNSITIVQGVNGNSHSLSSRDSKYYEVNGVRVLELKRSATVKHKEHKPITLSSGVWQIGMVNEYDYFSKMTRKVID